MTPPPPPRVLAIDPGGVHVGAAEFSRGECQRAWESGPNDILDFALDRLLVFDCLVIEEFRLYPQLAMTQTGSDMPTSQLIGALRWEAQKQGIRTVLQPASIKVPTAMVLKRRGVKMVAHKLKAGRHAADAELHGWHYLIRNKEEL